jgi:hypothetical protein
MFTRAKFTLLGAAMVLGVTLGASGAYAEPAKGISGRWIMPDNTVLIIRGSEWFHPVRGAATIRRQAGNTVRVDYHAFQGTGCTYRINTTAGGDILVLETADNTQSPDFCPNGRFSRSDQP